ncbi:hypothetical protein V8B97DRAFT_1948938 [Scleroderma yunnanense]
MEDQAASIRITRHGKIRLWVKKALEFFQANPEEPLVLYSSPSDVSTSTIPRLISVVEIVKREYLKGSATGLHQFNQLLFEDRSQVPVDGEERSSALLLALEGSSHPKQKLAPYMKVTLSAKALPDRPHERETYQSAAVRRLSKSAKARLKKRAKKQVSQ